MATLPKPRRHRSSTSRSNVPTTNIQAHVLELAVDQFIPGLSLQRSRDVLNQLAQVFDDAVDVEAVQDHFRRLHGYEKLIALLQELKLLSNDSHTEVAADGNPLDLLCTALHILLRSFKDHEGNLRYFNKRISRQGWMTIQDLSMQVSHMLLSSPDVQQLTTAICQLARSLLSLSLADESVASTFAIAADDADHKSKTEEGAIDVTEKVPPIVGSSLLPTNFTLVVPHALPTFVDLYVSVLRDRTDHERDLPSTLLAALETIAESSLYNRARLSGANVVQKLMSLLFNGTIPDIEHQRLHELCLNLLQAGVDNLESTVYLLQNASKNAIARKLLLQISMTPKPIPSIHFDMSYYGHSSVEIPNLPRTFPPASGYSWSCWINFDQIDDRFHTTIFGVQDPTSTSFVLIYLEQKSHCLILQTSVNAPNPSVRFKRAQFREKKWYHIALVHRPPKQGTNGEALLYVNGRYVERKEQCLYPQAPPPVSGGTSSSPFPPEPRERHPMQAFYGTPERFRIKDSDAPALTKWSLTNAHMYDICLSSDMIAVHAALGPYYAGNYQDIVGPWLTYQAAADINRYNQELYHDRATDSAIAKVINGRGMEIMHEGSNLISIFPHSRTSVDGILADEVRLESLLNKRSVHQLHVLTRTGNPILFNAARVSFGDALLRPEGTGFLMGKAFASVPRTLDDTCWQVGGFLGSGIRMIESAKDASALIETVQILFNCIESNWRLSEVMEVNNGYGLVALTMREKIGAFHGASVYALTKNSLFARPTQERADLIKELLLVVLKFLGINLEKPHSSVMLNPMAYRALLMDMDIWRAGTTDSQKLYYEQFTWLLENNKDAQYNSKRLTKARVIRVVLNSFKVEGVYKENLPFVLAAFEIVFTNLAVKGEPRDLANFIGYALQEGRASAIPLRNRRSTLKSQESGKRSPSLSSSPLRRTLSHMSQFQSLRLSNEELGIGVLERYAKMLCDKEAPGHFQKFIRYIPSRWLLHLLSESDNRIIAAVMRITARAMTSMDLDFKTGFEKNAGFPIIRVQLRAHWDSPSVWISCLSILFGQDVSGIEPPDKLSVMELFSIFPSDIVRIVNPEIMPTMTNMLETALKAAAPEPSIPENSDNFSKPATIITFLTDLQAQSPAFRDFAGNSQYIQELLFTLFPVVASTDRLSASKELMTNGESLTSKGHSVMLRPHANSGSQRPTILRAGSSTTLPENNRPNRIQAPRRTSSFVFIDDGDTSQPHLSAHFDINLAQAKDRPIRMRVGNELTESLLGMLVGILVDQVCTKKDFSGFGLFLKVPPGYLEHRAFFQSYLLQHIMMELWNHLQLNPALMQSPRALTNLSKFCQHVSEAVFEGWFIDGSQPLLDLVGNILDHLQQPEVAMVKDVRLCSQATTLMRSVFLRVTLWRLSELDETEKDDSTIDFLRKLTYWQTILFSPDNQELVFIRLLCYVFYTKLRSSSHAVRLATASLFRMLLVLKPTEAATILIHNADSGQRHLSTGLMRLSTHDDEELLQWVEERSALLDRFFLEILAKYWQEFVANESQRTEETRDNRLSKRREKLRQWQSEETDVDHVIQHYEHNTRHWRVNSHAQERLKLQRSTQDQQENIEHLRAAAARLNEVIQQPCGLFPDPGTAKWQLDPTESRNRMRLRLLRDAPRSNEIYQPKRKISEKIDLEKPTVSSSQNGSQEVPASLKTASQASGQPRQPLRMASGEIYDGSGENHMSSSSLLEGEFELVDDPKEEDESFDDKNRKIMRSVKPGDQIKHIYNASRIVGLEACEGLLIIGKKNLYIQDNMFHRSDGEIVSIAQAPAEERDDYVQLISGREIKTPRLQERSTSDSAKHWSWTDLLSLSRRRFLFRDVAIEVFFNDGQSYLLIFKSPAIRNDVYSNMVSRAPHVHTSISSLPEEDAWRVECLRIPEEVPQSIGSKFANVFNTSASNTATRKWMKGEISNFHYLMLVNTMAGRTFNDLTQYPVFPWVLADYSSDRLDLDDPRTYRDLSKPMGCQNPQRESDFRERYQSFAEMGEENPFHYGTHYSSAMIVTSYLIRIQPFVQSYLLLQGGSFDHPDRLFDSIENAWLSASKQIPTDVRELTPEFYYLPEFLQNINEYDFGVKQGGEIINDVQLPPWAKGDPHLFITKHREALESPYVSQHLHEWIDLVFGYKQRGQAAVEATNVFHPLSYHGTKNLDTMTDPVERLAAIGFIHNFGQTPHQVYQRPHPKRDHEKHDTLRLDSLAETLTRLPDPVMETNDRVSSLFWSTTSDRLVTASPCRLNIPPHGKAHAQWLFADNSLRFFHNSSKKLLALHEEFHIGPITTATFADARTLLTGGADSTIGVWDFASPSSDEIKIHPKTYLFGHRAAISVLAASWAFSTLVSASTDGQVIVWDLNRFDCLRILLPQTETGPAVTAAKINNVTGHILLCIGAAVQLYTLNGHRLLQQQVSDTADEDVLCATFYEGVGNEWVTSELLFTGHKRGVVKVWQVVTLDDGAWHLQLVKHLSYGEQVGVVASGITSVLATERTVFAGDESGRVVSILLRW